MNVAVGVGRAVMQDEAIAPVRRLAQPAIKAELLPTRENARLPLRQTAPHGEIGLRQKQRLGIVAGRLLHDLVHARLLTSRRCCGKGRGLDGSRRDILF